MSGKNRNRFESLHGVWTNPVYKTSWASLPAKQAVTVGSSSGFNVKLLHDWSNFDLPKLMPVEHIFLMPSSCLSLTLIHARIHANKLLITALPIRNLRPQKWIKGVLIAGVPSPLSPTPLPFSLFPYPLPLSMPATQATILPEDHCLNSARHRPLTAWNHTWAEMRISFRDLLWSFIRHSFQRIILADTAIKLMRRTQLKKRTGWNKNHSETVHQLENLWRCRGVLHKLSNRGYLRTNMHYFIYRKWTKYSDLNLIEFKITINLNNFYCSFFWWAEFKAGLFPFYRKRPVKSLISSCSRLKKALIFFLWYKLVRSPIWCVKII